MVIAIAGDSFARGLLGLVELSAYRLARRLKRVVGTSLLRPGWGRRAMPAAVYPLRVNVTDGGLMAYGPSYPDPFRRAAEYVDRILRGTKPEELPVQEPTKFELAINLKTAKALGVTFPPDLLSTADDVIG
jgi:hypothetical protein